MNRPIDLNQSRILVVDDESAIRRLLSMELRAAGNAEVTHCDDSRDLRSQRRAAAGLIFLRR